MRDPGLSVVDSTATVLYDGDCALCDATVRFVLANDPSAHFRFAAIGSAAGARILGAFGRLAATTTSIVVIDAAGLHERSGAALRIARGLRRPWCWFAVLAIVPAGMRDRLYDLVARNRYRWFGRRVACELPSAAERARFIDAAEHRESV